MITNERNKELTLARFSPIGGPDHYKFEYRGQIINVILCRNYHGAYWSVFNYGYDCRIELEPEMPAIEMAARIRQWILATVPADRLREEDYSTLGWISSSVRHALAQERAESRPVHFCGELNADDADDSIPGCYGL